MAIAAATTLILALITYLAFPVTGVRVEGARMYPESEVTNAIPDHASLLTLNEEMLKRNLESHPWVQGTEVNEDWNSGIVTVQVEERRPVLDAEVDGRRMILAADGTRLPGLGGADLERVELDEDLWGEVVEFARVLDTNGVRLDSIDEAGPGGIEATVEGRRVVFSGDISDGQARVLEGVMAEHPDAEIFDLRSPQRVVVGGSSSAGANGGPLAG